MERGEIDGYFASLDSVFALRPDWIPNNQVTLLFQGGAAPNPTLKNVPFVVDLARTPEEKAAIEFLYAGLGLSRPFIAPPGMPADRVKMVRMDGFMATMSDPGIHRRCRRSRTRHGPQDGEELAALIRRIMPCPRRSWTGLPSCRSNDEEHARHAALAIRLPHQLSLR